MTFYNGDKISDRGVVDEILKQMENGFKRPDMPTLNQIIGENKYSHPDLAMRAQALLDKI